jgi:hypothetical protein
LQSPVEDWNDCSENLLGDDDRWVVWGFPDEKVKKSQALQIFVELFVVFSYTLQHHYFSNQQQSTMARAWLLRNTTLWGGLMLFTVLSLFQKLQITQVLVLEDDATPGRFWNNLPPPPRQLSNLAASNDITRTTPLRQQHKIPSISTTNHGRNNNRQPVQDSTPLKKKTTSSRTTIQDDDTVVPDASIVVQLSGEMGNNLNKIAFGRGLQLLMKEQYGIHVNLVLRHQAHPKWILARKSIQKCFPNLRQFDFEAGNRPEMKEREIQQKLTFGYKSFGLILNEKVHNETRTMQVLDNLQALVNQTRGNSNSNMPMMMMEPGANIRVPYILADQMVDLSFLDRFKDDFWEFFQFDDQRCCAQLPEADETVFVSIHLVMVAQPDF